MGCPYWYILRFYVWVHPSCAFTSACLVPDLESVGVCSTIVAEHFGAMALPVGEFLALEHGTEFWGVDRAELQVRRHTCFSSSQPLELHSASPLTLYSFWLLIYTALTVNTRYIF